MLHENKTWRYTHTILRACYSLPPFSLYVLLFVIFCPVSPGNRDYHYCYYVVLDERGDCAR